MTLTLTASTAPDEPEAQRRQTNEKERDKDADNVHPRSQEARNHQKANPGDSHCEHHEYARDRAVAPRAACGTQDFGNYFKDEIHGRASRI
jgi:hypothetical protein